MIRHFKKYCLLAALLFAFYGHSQQDSSSTEKTNKITFFPKKIGDKKWRFLIGLDARRSFFSGKLVKINGIRLGAEIWGVHRFGNGFYGLQKDIVYTSVNLTPPDAHPEGRVKFNLSYSSIFYERVFIKTPRWEVAFPLSLGIGKIRSYYRDTTDNYQFLFDHPFSSVSPALQVKFYVLPWLALRVQGGYRQTFNTEPEVKKAFNTAFFGYGLSISLGELYRSIFKKKKPKEEEPIQLNPEDDDWH